MRFKILVFLKLRVTESISVELHTKIDFAYNFR